MKEKAKQFAFKSHQDVNQKYGDKPYSYHLQMVADVGEEFIHLIPENKRDIVISACYCHDLIEDARMTYNDVKNVLGEEVAEIVYALTNEKGRTRKERANDKYYQGIRETHFASFVKVCDRIANVRNSKTDGSRMFEMYKKENQNFIDKIYDEDYKEIFDYLKLIFL
jgi:(p)ppGpp synthase/HD superfamily hydrolase